MIKSFKCRKTQALYEGQSVKSYRSIKRVALRKLDMIAYAALLHDLSSPPGNRLESLKGRRKGQHSIRINDQYRICFRWRDDGAEDVEIVDYH